MHSNLQHVHQNSDDVASFIGGATGTVLGYITQNSMAEFMVYSVIGGIVGVVVKRIVDASIDLLKESWNKRKKIKP